MNWTDVDARVRLTGLIALVCAAAPDHGLVADRASSDALQATTRTQVVWRITPGRVGPLEVGKPLPALLLRRDLAAHYAAAYIADAQAVDTFGFDDPPVTIILASQTFAEFERRGDSTATGPGPATTRLRDKAAEAARRGAIVTRVMIRSAGPATETGLGVGSTLEQLQRAYADLKLQALPPTLGADQCVAVARSFPRVGFVFTNCSKAKQGEPVKRVDLWHDS